VKEAHIKCLCRSIRLPDLQVTLEQGQEVIVSESRALKSGDLARAVRHQGVSVRYTTVCAVQRQEDALPKPQAPIISGHKTPVQQVPVVPKAPKTVGEKVEIVAVPVSVPVEEPPKVEEPKVSVEVSPKVLAEGGEVPSRGSRRKRED
jgi:hypothetical protein